MTSSWRPRSERSWTPATWSSIEELLLGDGRVPPPSSWRATVAWWVPRSCDVSTLPGTRISSCEPRSELDLTDASATREFFEEARPEYVFLAAAKVGGYASANDSCPADFIRENLSIQTSVIHSAWESGGPEAPLSGEFLYLSQACASADGRGAPADRPARDYQ